MAKRAPRRITAVYLARVTGHYLERYATTRANLRRLLGQRVRRSAAHHDEPVPPWMKLVDSELDRLERLGLVDDHKFCEDRARRLWRRGTSLRVIRQRLRQKGASGECIDAALDALAAGLDVDPELIAAAQWARKRGLGPWNLKGPEVDREVRRKHLAKFGRAGFSYDIARAVLDAAEAEDLPVM